MQLLVEEFEILKNDLIDAHDKKGMRASGQWADSLEVVQDNPFNVKLLGLKYSQQLESGRSAGGMPPISVIKKWINDKNVFTQISNELQLTSLAWAIAKKIQREGWNRKGFGGVELISSVITPARMQLIIDKLGAEMALTQTELLINDLKNFAV